MGAKLRMTRLTFAGVFTPATVVSETVEAVLLFVFDFGPPNPF